MNGPLPRASVLALPLAFLLSGCSGGTPTAPTGQSSTTAPPSTTSTTIGGTVRSIRDGSPVAGGTVEVVAPASELGRRTVTTEMGTFRLPGIEAVTFTVRYGHAAFEPFEREYTFMRGSERLDLDAQLTPLQPSGTPWSQLPAVSATARGFIVAFNLESRYSGSDVGAVKRWADGPITIYASSDFRPNDLVEAVRFWESETGGKLRFRIVNSPAEAAVVFDQQWPPPGIDAPSWACGVEGPGRVENNVIVSGFGHYAFAAKPECRGNGDNRIGLAHGIGHVLGIGGHTGSGADVMGSPQSDWRSSPFLREVINWLYSVPAGTRPQ